MLEGEHEVLARRIAGGAGRERAAAQACGCRIEHADADAVAQRPLTFAGTSANFALDVSSEHAHGRRHAQAVRSGCPFPDRRTVGGVGAKIRRHGSFRSSVILQSLMLISTVESINGLNFTQPKKCIEF